MEKERVRKREVNGRGIELRPTIVSESRLLPVCLKDNIMIGTLADVIPELLSSYRS